MITYIDNLSVDTCISNPDIIYLFGDNMEGWGMRGQAVIRHQPNAVGIPTKVAPRWDNDAYFTDDMFDTYRQVIDDAFNRIPNNTAVAVPTNGLGTGLAQLPDRAPRLYQHILDRIQQLK